MRTGAQQYVIVQGISVVLDVLRNIMVANLLGPAGLGLCFTLLVVPQIAQYFNLGLNEVLTVVIPYCRAGKAHNRVEHVRHSVLTATWWISFVSFIFVTLFAIFLRPGHTQSNYFLVLSGSLIILWELRQFFLMNYAAEGRFGRLSFMELLFSLLVTVSQIGFMSYLNSQGLGVYNGYGFWFGFIIANGVMILWAGNEYRKSHSLKPFCFDLSEYKRLIPLGIGLLVASVTYAPFLILARIYLAYGVSLQEVGLFMLSVAIITKLSIIPSSIAKIVTPSISFVHGEGGDFKKVFRLFGKAQLCTFFLSLTVIGVGYLLMEFFIRWFLPSYVDGVPAAKVMLLSMIPYCLIDNANNMLLALQQKRLYFLNLAIILVLFVFGSTYLLWSERISVWTMSFLLFFTFLAYALLVNFAVIRQRITEMRSLVPKSGDRLESITVC